MALKELMTIARVPAFITNGQSLLHDHSNVVMEAFRQSAKSSYVLRAFPLHCISFPHKDRDFIVIIKNNATQAKQTKRDSRRVKR